MPFLSMWLWLLLWSGHNSSAMFVDLHKLFMSLFFVQGHLSPAVYASFVFFSFWLLLSCGHIPLMCYCFLEGDLLPPPPSPTSTWCWALCFMCHKLCCTRPIAFLAAYGGRVTDTICAGRDFALLPKARIYLQRACDQAADLYLRQQCSSTSQ